MVVNVCLLGVEFGVVLLGQVCFLRVNDEWELRLLKALVKVLDLRGTDVDSLRIVVHPLLLDVCGGEHLLVFHKAGSVVGSNRCCIVMSKVIEVVVAELKGLILELPVFLLQGLELVWFYHVQLLLQLLNGLSILSDWQIIQTTFG